MIAIDPEMEDTEYQINWFCRTYGDGCVPLPLYVAVSHDLLKKASYIVNNPSLLLVESLALIRLKPFYVATKSY
ncbi:hypothetical protein JG687_00016925 [Phytophthora cactorum]|uniref:Uncharacterized protein n=1 Tax=Phytophthora cactorum TaxID=29920 RepID=A0A8T1TSL4_9STRA|nr:hypothetical protein JG687_00016925 [Phytophthora cactorum]